MFLLYFALSNTLSYSGVVSNEDAVVSNIDSSSMLKLSNISSSKSVNYVKQCIKNLGVNITQSALFQEFVSQRNRIGNFFLALTRKLISTGSGKHTHKSDKNDLDIIVGKLIQQDMFKYQIYNNSKYIIIARYVQMLG